MKPTRKLWKHTLSCGHIRTAFSKKSGPGFACGECNTIVDSVKVEACDD